MLKITPKDLEKIYGVRESYDEFYARQEKLTKVFVETFGEEPKHAFSSPGRIEICGNHTDHNNGLVLVAAVDCDMLAMVSPADDVRVLSEGYSEIRFNLSEVAKVDREIGTSTAMIKGVLRGFMDRGYQVGGFHIAMDSKIYKGAGVSSSAAYELLIAEILNRFYNNDIDRIELAKIGAFAENEYFGKPSGLLDQSGISLGGICQIDFKGEPVVSKLGTDLNGLETVIVNTGDHSNLTDEYSAIRSEMNAVASCFGKKVLREVEESEFYASIPTLAKKVPGRAILRAMHYFEENARVLRGTEAVRNGDTAAFLSVITESGESSDKYLQNTFVSGDRAQELKLALKISKNVIKNGAVRVHGGGFAGTIIAFLPKEEVAPYVETMAAVFGEKNVILAKVRGIGASIIA